MPVDWALSISSPSRSIFDQLKAQLRRLPDAAQLLNLQGQQRAAVCILYRFGSENATLHHSHESSGNKSMRHEKALGFRQGDSRVITVQFTGTWKNELGSEMTLVQTGQSLTGKYESVVSGKGHKITGELSGWANQRLISVSVNWPTPAITAWVGHLVREDGKDAIETLWQMTTGMQNPEDPSELWESVFAGADRFVRVS